MAADSPGNITMSKSHRPPFEVFYPYLIILLFSYLTADSIILQVRDLMLPSQAPPTMPKKNDFYLTLGRSAYNTITSRNMFTLDGVIPDPLHIKKSKEQGEEQKELPPIPSTLPLNLMGTIVHSNEVKSIANIEIQSKNTVIPFKVNQEIEGMGTLLKVERGKIFIKNLNTNRTEYIELKDKNKLTFNTAPKMSLAPPNPKQDIRNVGQNKYEINRADLLKYTADLPSFLQTAAMQPRKKPNGEVDGFKFIAIQPGGPIAMLGFQTGDTIKAVNGEPVDSPAKAMELYNALKSSGNVNILIERDGKETNMDYNVK